MNDAHMPREVMKWCDALPGSSSMFSIWISGQDRIWGEWAWKKLAKVRGTAFSNALERCEVQLRLIALFTMYCDFSGMALDEMTGYELGIWASELDLDQISLGRLLERHKETESEDLSDSIASLLPTYREQVFEMLVKSLGNRELLFLSFFLSNEAPAQLSKLSMSHPIANILNTVTPSTGQVYEWIDQGCPANGL